MYGTGMQNPIFGMMNSMSQNNNQGTGMNMNQNMMSQNMNNMGLMNNPINSMPNLNNNGTLMGNSNNMMGNQIYMPNTNPMMNMNNMNNMMNMNMAQMSQQLQNQYQNQLQNMNSNMGINNPVLNQSQEIKTPESNNFITLVFRTSNQTDDLPVKIQCLKSDLLSSVFEKYRNKANDKDMTKKFIFNAKQLDKTMTVGEAGLYEGSTIFVVTTENIVGA